MLKAGLIQKMITSFIATRVGLWGLRKLWESRPKGAAAARPKVHRGRASQPTVEW